MCDCSLLVSAPSVCFSAAVFHTKKNPDQVSGFEHLSVSALSLVKGRGRGSVAGEHREDRGGVTGYYRHPESRTDG